MNIFELGFAVMTVGGAITGGNKGYEGHGFLGAIIGVPVGAAIGLSIAFLLTFLIAAVFSVAFGDPLFKPRRGKSDG